MEYQRKLSQYCWLEKNFPAYILTSHPKGEKTHIGQEVTDDSNNHVIGIPKACTQVHKRVFTGEFRKRIINRLTANTIQ
ncbi:MAG: hypothetical protein U0T82_03245 [Bacteroidales bacterium]